MKALLRFFSTAAPFAIVGSVPLRRVETKAYATGSAYSSRGSHDANVDAILADGNVSHNEAITLKTWVSLKEGMTQIRNEVKHLLSIKDDISMLQDDLKTQENVWHEAEGDLSKENAALLAEVEKLRAQVKAGDGLQKEVEGLRLNVEVEKRSTQEQWRQTDSEEQREQLERRFLEQRRANLTKLRQDFSNTTYVELDHAHARQLQLETDTVALRLKAAELQDRLKTGAKQLLVQEEQASAKTVDLKRQLVSMQDGLSRVQANLQNTGAVDQQYSELAEVKIKIDKEIASMVAVKEEQAKVADKCEQMKDARDDARCAEEQKSKQRRQEMQELCQPVHGQLQALQAMLSDCKAGAIHSATE